MMVTFVSECEKKALNRTRRVLDAFADRIGTNTWQTVITHEGLLAVRKLLRKTASKNTAVSCHWIRSRARSQLVWIVGDKQKFNAQGRVPVNTTQRDLVKSDWKNQWTQAPTIQIIATLSALLHDVGKATVGFQRKLEKDAPQGLPDPYRHEWISLHLFLALVQDCATDEAWLLRLTQLSTFFDGHPDWLKFFGYTPENGNLSELPPLAQMVSWLIVTHHRLPFRQEPYSKSSYRDDSRHSEFLFDTSIDEFFAELAPAEYWVKNARDWEVRQDHHSFWQLKAPLLESKKWQKALARWSNKALAHLPSIQSPKQLRTNPLVLHLARLCLMIGDHNFSSLNLAQSNLTVRGDDPKILGLIANTDQETRTAKQSLDQHLLGVGIYTAQFSRQLPGLSQQLPRLEADAARALTTATENRIFKWQNQAFDLARSVQPETQDDGFFGINMASTGTGKTIGNARIMYGLSDPNLGARFTIALGLRVLTLQTGQALTERLNLNGNSLAVLVGSSASQVLFEANQIATAEETNLEQSGSESANEIVDEEVFLADDAYADFQDNTNLGTVIENPKARKLLLAPIVTCTIDHMIKATENTRGGKHIAPMLRLLSSDLVLDEPDDFGAADLAAIARLVHFAGMLGTKVLLSSATLTPDFSAGLFKAYLEGRKICNEQLGLAEPKITCGWFDEHKVTHQRCSTDAEFEQQHNQFAGRRERKLKTLPVQRKAEVLVTDIPRAAENQAIHYPALAQILVKASYDLHNRYNEKRGVNTASIGLIRFANISPLIAIAKELYATAHEIEDVQIHLCCYHARQLLVLRNSLEAKLDKILRRSSSSSLFDHSEISKAISSSPRKHHIFIVLATPVAEVGRDHDYDWAVIEPSSMRSIIQLAGRVWRHRPDKVVAAANIKILNTNIKALRYGNSLGIGNAVFQRPGFETARPNFLLESHKIDDIIRPGQMAVINSAPRIMRPQNILPNQYLADLEHSVMASLLNNQNPNYINSFWANESANRLHVYLQKISPFREQIRKEDDYIYLPDSSSERDFNFHIAEQAWAQRAGADTVNSRFDIAPIDMHNQGAAPWLNDQPSEALHQLSEKLGLAPLDEVALRYATVSLPDLEARRWHFHPLLGFSE